MFSGPRRSDRERDRRHFPPTHHLRAMNPLLAGAAVLPDNLEVYVLIVGAFIFLLAVREVLGK